MKKEIHPEYRTVLFHDLSVDKYYLIPSTLETDQTKEWEDGNTYPYCPLDVSSASHPFYTGQSKIIDTGGRVERFKKRFSKKKAAATPTPTEESPQEVAPPEEIKVSDPAEEAIEETTDASTEATEATPTDASQEEISVEEAIEETTDASTEATEATPTDAPQEEISVEEASDESSNSSEEK